MLQSKISPDCPGTNIRSIHNDISVCARKKNQKPKAQTITNFMGIPVQINGKKRVYCAFSAILSRTLERCCILIYAKRNYPPNEAVCDAFLSTHHCLGGKLFEWSVPLPNMGKKMTESSEQFGNPLARNTPENDNENAFNPSRLQVDSDAFRSHIRNGEIKQNKMECRICQCSIDEWWTSQSLFRCYSKSYKFMPSPSRETAYNNNRFSYR